ncbi:MAG: OsmC family protein [Planctomycetota bacterium]
MSEPLHTATAVTGVTPFKTDITLPTALVMSDAPGEHGGQGIGPSPVDLLTGALSACKTMTAMMYARRKEWPVESIRIDVRHVQKQIDGKPGDVFECDVVIEGDLTDEQRRRVYEISNKCPVHKMLAGETPVESGLVGG